MRKTQNSTAPLIEAFASLSRKAAGSQGSALSRPSQRAESSFDFPVPRKGKSTKFSFKAPPAGGKTSRAPGAFMEGTVHKGRFPPLPALRPTCGTRLGAGRSRGKPIRQVGLHERPLAAGELRGCGRA